ncbi:hypothetical protein ACIHEJ_07875 [Streptomyces sp. NPDC052301]|uniref:hypothetical protein n=1 Tax=Streptomyces sp. NPDC052301 TaxID=3365687 RepID=UPI0037D64D53
MALAEGARFQVIPGLIAQRLRGGHAWAVGPREYEIHDWSDRSALVVNAHTVDSSGTVGSVWQQRR